MGELLSIDQAALLCGVSRDTIRRRLRAGGFPGATKGTAHGGRERPWLIPGQDLVAAGMVTADTATIGCAPHHVDTEDPTSLRVALAHHQALATAREAHLADLRVELDRVHARLDHCTATLLAADAELASMAKHLADSRDCAHVRRSDCQDLPSEWRVPSGDQAKDHD